MLNKLILLCLFVIGSSASTEYIELENHETIKNVKMDNDYIFTPKEENKKINIQYKNCSFIFNANSFLPNDEFSYIRLNLSSAKCSTKSKYAEYNYNLSGEGYNKKDGYLAYIPAIPLKTKNGDTLYIIKKNTNFNIDIRFLFSKKYQVLGNYVFQTKLVDTSKIDIKEKELIPGRYTLGQRINFSHIQRKEFFSEECSGNKLPKTKNLILRGSYALNCQDNLDFKNKIKCQLTLFDIEEFNKQISENINNKTCKKLIPIQKIKKYDLKIKLSENHKIQSINFDNFKLYYKYYFVPLNKKTK
jgi:hypothetical protein